jgi:hypothetical protein
MYRRDLELQRDGFSRVVETPPAPAEQRRQANRAKKVNGSEYSYCIVVHPALNFACLFQFIPTDGVLPAQGCPEESQGTSRSWIASLAKSLQPLP